MNFTKFSKYPEDAKAWKSYRGKKQFSIFTQKNNSASSHSTAKAKESMTAGNCFPCLLSTGM